MKYIIPVILMTILFSSCKMIDDITSEDKPLNVICLVDFSGSISDETIKSYNDIIKIDIFKNLNFKDKITVLPIDKASQTSSLEIFRLDIANVNFELQYVSPQQKEKSEKRNLDAFKDSIAVQIDSSFNQALGKRKQYGAETDIIGAIAECKKYLLGEGNNLIVILSDMVQETPNVNLASIKNEKSVVDLLEKSGNIELNNTEVIVLTGEQSDVTKQQFDVTKLFWSKYFEKNNIKLVDYSSGGRTILSEKVKSYNK